MIFKMFMRAETILESSEDFQVDEIGYTYDRIILGIMTSLVCLYILLQIGLTFYHKHKVPSFHFGFLVLCCIWMILRTVYYFSVIENCGVFFLYYLPICVEFAVFTLLVVFFFKLLNYGGGWDKSIFSRSHHNSTPPSNSILVGSGVQSPPERRRSSRNRINDSYGAVSNHHHVSVNAASEDDDTKSDASFVSQNLEDVIYEEDSKSSYYKTSTGAKYYKKLLKSICTKKVIYMVTWLISNFVFLAIILSFCITSCTTAIEIEQTNSIIGFASACSFTILMIMLLIIGIRMVYIFRRRNDIPVSLKVSRITGPGMIVVIIVNCFVFTSRAIFDCLILIPNFPKDYLKIQFLRSTDYGRIFIIVTNFFWEIMPILSILIFFSKFSFGRNVVNMSFKRQVQPEDETPESESTNVDHVFDPNTPLVIGTNNNRNGMSKRNASSGYLIQEGETTESSLYDDIETDSSYSAND